MYYKFAWLLFIFSLSIFANSKEELKAVAYSKEWLRLLHYQPRYFGGYKSDADGAAFFIAENGKYDPLAELEANLSLYDKDIKIGFDKYHPQCAFPLRYKFLKKKFNLQIADVACDDLKWWLERINPKSLSLIFSSAYPNNPASIYGHTFLKVNRKEDGKDIRDFAVDFSAMTDTDSGLVFAMRGLFGGYVGQFATKPYYMKVNEYISGESRDLWEYRLNFTEEESIDVVLHLWELRQNTFFDYYFFDENCSYQILTLLEAVRPHEEISTLEFFYTLPPETVKRVDKKNYVVESSPRPSLRKQLLWKRSKLNSKQESELYTLYDQKKLVTDSQDLYVLDTLSTFLNFKIQERKGTDKDKELLRNLLLHRASFKTPSPFQEQELITSMKNENVLFSHGSNRVSLALGYEEKLKSFAEFEFRLGLHALSDYPRGYPRTSHFEYARFRARYEEEAKRFFLQDYTFIKINSLFPILPRDFDKSWSIQAYGERPKDRMGENSLSHIFQTSMGVSIGFFHERLISYFLPGLQLEFAGGLEKNFRYGPLARLGFMFEVIDGLNLVSEFKTLYDANNNFEENWVLSSENTMGLKLSQNTQLRFSSAFYSQTRENLKYSSESKLEFDFFF